MAEPTLAWYAARAAEVAEERAAEAERIEFLKEALIARTDEYAQEKARRVKAERRLEAVRKAMDS